MRGKVKAALLLSTLLILCCCQRIYNRAVGGLWALAADGEEETPPPAEIKGYLISYGGPDGDNGYYKRVPKIEITNQDKELNTTYRFTEPSGETQEGEIQGEAVSASLEKEAGDGVYRLEIWLEKNPEPEEPEPEEPKPGEPEEPKPEEPEEPKPGGPEEPAPEEPEPEASEPEAPEYLPEELEKWRKTFTWEVDSAAPVIEIISPQSGKWYNQAVTVRINARDGGSGLDVLTGTDGETYAEKKGEELQFVTKSVSVGNQPLRVKICAKDRAGNTAEAEMPIFVDYTPPVLAMEGAENYTISGKNVELVFAAQEENSCAQVEALMEWETAAGEKSQRTLSEWHAEDGRLISSEKLEQDGIYRFTLTASDQAGNYVEKKSQVIIDKTNPVIRCIQLFQGKWMKEFCWNYDAAEIVEDFTTYSYHLEMDGRLYLPGQRIMREGRHVLTLAACDAAGNEASLSVEFMIDRTPPELLWEEQETGERIADGKDFEKEAGIQIQTKYAEDKITEIKINGKRQQIPGNNPIYRCTLAEELPYEISVSAVDKAGNQITDIRTIRVVREKSVLEKIAEPVKKVFRKDKSTQEPEQGYGEVEGARRPVTTGILLTAIALCAVSGAILGYRYRKRKASPESEAE